jgi:lysyl-tRNA synthetase class II
LRFDSKFLTAKGIDRLVMMPAGVPTIRDVVLFRLLKRKE